MEELLTLAHGFPQRSVAAGAALLTDGESVGTLYVLLEGALRVEKAGQLIAAVTEPGACVGEKATSR